MGAVYFYQLTQSPLEATLPTLLEKSRGAGWRVLVRARETERLAWLDQRLWLGEGFLPHGISGGTHDADQPILLASEETTSDEFQCLMVIDGANVSADEVASIERACVLFDGADQAALETARGQWKQLTEAGVTAQYWAQEDGRWAKKAESG